MFITEQNMTSLSTSFFSPNTNRFLKRVDELDSRLGTRKYRNHRCLLCADGSDLCLFRKNPLPQEVRNPDANGILLKAEKSTNCFNLQMPKFAWMEKKPKSVKKIKF